MLTSTLREQRRDTIHPRSLNDRGLSEELEFIITAFELR
jgi:hypothetical protein